MAYARPKQCTDLKERSELRTRIQIFFPTARHLFISALLFDLTSCTHPASAAGRHLRSETQVVVAVLTSALCRCAYVSSTHVLGPREETEPRYFTRLLWVKLCGEPDAQGRQACWSGIKVPQRSAQRKLFPAESCTHLPLQRLWSASHRAEPFVSDHKPKVSTNLPIYYKNYDKILPDRQESLVPLFEVGGKRYILGRQGLALAVPLEEEMLHDPVGTAQTWTTRIRLLWRFVTAVIHSHTSFLSLQGQSKLIFLETEEKWIQLSRIFWFSIWPSESSAVWSQAFCTLPY